VIKKFLNCDSGATALEYSLITAIISIAIFAGANGVAKALGNYFFSVNGSL